MRIRKMLLEKARKREAEVRDARMASATAYRDGAETIGEEPVEPTWMPMAPGNGSYTVRLGESEASGDEGDNAGEGLSFSTGDPRE